MFNILYNVFMFNLQSFSYQVEELQGSNFANKSIGGKRPGTRPWQESLRRTLYVTFRMVSMLCGGILLLRKW